MRDDVFNLFVFGIYLYAYFVQSVGSYSYFVRGAYFINLEAAGILSTHYATGTVAPFYGSRVVVGRTFLYDR